MNAKKRDNLFLSRIGILSVITYLIGVLICGRIFVLSVVRHEFYLAKAEIQELSSRAQLLKRGEIYAYDRNGEKQSFAINKGEPLIYVEPNRIKEEDIKKTAEKLSVLLEIDEEFIMDKLKQRNDPFEVIKRKASEEEVRGIEQIGIRGIGVKVEDSVRFYPSKNLACHLIGFLGYRNGERAGQYGVEEYYNQLLAGGENILIESQLEKDEASLIQGNDVCLTIDPNVQFFIEEGLARTVEEYGAQSGSVLVMDPKDGRIIALSNYPNFDLNNYARVKDFGIFVNQAISTVFEPGSVFKPLIMAMALEENKILPSDTYVDKGYLKIGGFTIFNADQKVYGEQTMSQILEKSINTGIVYVGQKLEKETFKNYLEKFGFGRKTGIDLPGEVSGSIDNLESGRDINFATASFGQGISVTPLQLIRALAAIANKGILPQPKVVEIPKANDSIEESDNYQKRVISEETANRIIAMMVNTVEDGTAKLSRLESYWVAAKTGTAQVPLRNKKGYGDETIHSIIGFAPAYDARFIVLVKLDQPSRGRFAANTTASLFKDITEYLLNYWEIPPEK